MINGSAINAAAINASGNASQSPDVYLLDGVNSTAALIVKEARNVFESYAASGNIDVCYSIHALEQLQIASNMETFYNPQGDITDEVLLADIQRIALLALLTDEIEVEGTPAFVYVTRIAETLVATGAAQTFFHGVMEVLSIVTAADTARRAESASITDEIELEDTVLEYFKQLAQLLDEIEVSSSTQLSLTIIVEETAELEAADSLELNAKLLAELLDDVDVYSLMKTPSEIAQGWLINTEGDMPISEYDNYTFDSLTQYGGEFYGTSDTGLYLMGADDDAGEPIVAELATMMLDFGTSRLKRIRSAYLGYTSDNEMVLKVRAVSDGQLFEHWFKACPVTADAPREGRIRVAKGLRSRYWQFELTNIEGGDFEIDQLEMYPVMLSRRV